MKELELFGIIPLGDLIITGLIVWYIYNSYTEGMFLKDELWKVFRVCCYMVITALVCYGALYGTITIIGKVIGIVES